MMGVPQFRVYVPRPDVAYACTEIILWEVLFAIEGRHALEADAGRG